MEGAGPLPMLALLSVRDCTGQQCHPQPADCSKVPGSLHGTWGASMQHSQHFATAASRLTTVLEQLQAGSRLNLAMGSMSSS